MTGALGVRHRDAASGRSAVGGGQYAHLMAFFAVTMVHGQAWDASRQIREQDAWDEHAAFMDGLVDDGLVLLGGPIGNGDRAMLVVDAADEHEIEARLGGDPWAPMGLLRIGTIEPWRIWLGRPGPVLRSPMSLRHGTGR